MTGSNTPPQGLATDAKINGIVDDISGLTLLQAAELVSALKVRLVSFALPQRYDFDYSLVSS